MSLLPFPLNSLVFLESKELADLQAVNDETLKSSEISFAWRQCNERECSLLVVSSHLYDRACRHEVLRCRALLKDVVPVKGMGQATGLRALKAGLGQGTGLKLTSAAETGKLREALALCHGVASEHRAAGGRVARVLIGHFDVAGPASADQKPCSFALGVEGPGGCKGELRISLGIQESQLFVSALHSRTATLQRIAGGCLQPASIILDVFSASTECDLGCRNMSVTVDSLPRLGDSAWVKPSSDSGKDLASPILCALCVRESTNVSWRFEQ
mmetsp:Transcript_50984/g.110614  ORF Transcript_50984/g.110614 Transcript_50984/m.110614 type:complete len:272 (+) Transcript_50984:44-859(+)